MATLDETVGCSLNYPAVCGLYAYTKKDQVILVGNTHLDKFNSIIHAGCYVNVYELSIQEIHHKINEWISLRLLY